MGKIASKKVVFSLRLSRIQFYLFFLLVFLFPIVATAYCASLGDQNVFTIAALASAMAGYAVYRLLIWWERRMRRVVDELVRRKCHLAGEMPNWEELQKGYEHQIDLLQSSVEKSKAHVHELNLEMETKLSEMRLAYLEFEDLRKEYHRLEEEYHSFKKEVEAKEEQKERILAEYQRTTQEQRGVLESKQRYIEQLEGRVRDLMYEIRSLLQLEEPVTQKIPPIDLSNQEEVHDYYLGDKTPLFDLDWQLQRYLELAEGLTGAEHLGYAQGKERRFLDQSSTYAIDLRRLYDALRDETAGVIFLFSTAEKKFLFANNYVKTLLGCSPERFVKEFPQLVKAGLRIWQEALEKIHQSGTKRLQLIMLDKGGQEVHVECEMRVITKGPFAHHVMGLITK